MYPLLPETTAMSPTCFAHLISSVNVLFLCSQKRIIHNCEAVLFKIPLGSENNSVLPFGMESTPG